MNEAMIFRIACGVAALVTALAATLTVRMTPGGLHRVEGWPRNRTAGMILGWIALAVCVPHASAVSPDFLLPFLWPLAVAIPVAGFFFVDYPLARALGGMMILGAYYLIHSSFAVSSPAAPAAAVTGWLFGFAGIWISGRPCSLRDWLRKISGSAVWRWSSAGFLLWCAVILAVSAILPAGGR